MKSIVPDANNWALSASYPAERFIPQPTTTFDTLNRYFWLNRFSEMSVAQLKVAAKALGIVGRTRKNELVAALTQYFYDKVR